MKALVSAGESVCLSCVMGDVGACPCGQVADGSLAFVRASLSRPLTPSTPPPTQLESPWRAYRQTTTTPPTPPPTGMTYCGLP